MTAGSLSRITIRLLALYMGIQGTLGVISQVIFALRMQDSLPAAGDMPGPLLLVGLSVLPLLGAALLWVFAPGLSPLMAGPQPPGAGCVVMSEPLIMRMMIAWAGIYLVATTVPPLVSLWMQLRQTAGPLLATASRGDLLRWLTGDSYMVGRLWDLGVQAVLGVIFVLGSGGAARIIQWLAEARRA